MWKQSAEAVGKAIRSLGQSLDRAGVSLEGSLSYTEHRTFLLCRPRKHGGGDPHKRRRSHSHFLSRLWCTCLTRPDGTPLLPLTPVNPSTRAVANVGRRPSFAPGAFVAPNASVIGDVKVGKGSSIWYGATVRGTLLDA